MDEIEEFVTGARSGGDSERILATLLFTDIVGSTSKAAELGDRRWKDLLEEHHKLVRTELLRFKGRELDTAGDGFFATFDGPGAAIRCALAIIGAAPRLAAGSMWMPRQGTRVAIGLLRGCLRRSWAIWRLSWYRWPASQPARDATERLSSCATPSRVEQQRIRHRQSAARPTGRRRQPVRGG